jgi:hypothetical protein
MAFKVSYRILREQGESMKNVSKSFDGYMEEIGRVSSGLGDDQMLSQVRSNLSKLQEQLSEVSAILALAGEVLIKIVEGYSGAEKRQVKRSSGTKAHSRDFYKRPVVVVPAGGGGGAAAGFAPPQPTYVDQSTHVTYNAAPGANAPPSASFPGAAAPQGGAAATVGQTAGAAAAAAVGAAGGAAAALHLKDRSDAKKEEAARKKGVEDAEGMSELNDVIKEAKGD